MSNPYFHAKLVPTRIIAPVRSVYAVANNLQEFQDILKSECSSYRVEGVIRAKSTLPEVRALHNSLLGTTVCELEDLRSTNDANAIIESELRRSSIRVVAPIASPVVEDDDVEPEEDEETSSEETV